MAATFVLLLVFTASANQSTLAISTQTIPMISKEVCERELTRLVQTTPTATTVGACIQTN